MSDNKVTLDQLDNSAVEAMSSSVGDVSMLNTENKTIVGALAEIVGKKEIANAIGEPLAETDKFTEMSSEINGLLSTFKTNMMNAGVVVESGDKFKALIDKIKGLTEGEGNKGIQYAEGTFPTPFTTGVIRNGEYICDIDCGFTPTVIFIEIPKITASLSDSIYCEKYVISNLSSFELYYGSTNDTMMVNITNITDASVTLSVTNAATSTSSGLKVYSKSIFNYYAIGVGEDTTLRDLLADILENKGVDVTEEDDMASLITKVDSIGGGLDIISATELPATGKENQICVITDNPVDSFSVSSDSNNFASGSIGVLLEANNPVLGGNITLSSNNIITNYPIYKIYQNNAPMNSFYWSNGMWNKLTIDYLYLVNNGKLENTNYFGSIASGNTWKVNDSGLVTSGNDTYVNQFTSFSNLINFNHFKKVDITFTSSKTNSSNYKPSIYVGSFKTVINDNSSTTSSYPVAHMNQYKLASNLTCSAGVAQTVTLDISAITGEYYFGFAFKSYTDWTITVSNIRLY